LLTLLNEIVCILCCVKDKGKFIVCDEIAMALALDERIATAVVDASCSVETKGLLTRGQMVVDRSPFKSNAAKVRLVTGLDLERFVQLLTAAVID